MTQNPYLTDPHRRRKGYARPARASQTPISPIAGLSARTIQEALEEISGRVYPPSPPGMLMDLQFLEGSGNETYDSANPGRAPLSLVGPPAWTPLGDINILDFNGTTDYLTLPNADKPDLNFTTEEFTFACWFKVRSLAGFQYLVQTADRYDNGWRVYTVSAGLVNCSYRDSIGNQYNNGMLPGVITIDTWYFVAYVFTATDVKPYLNGVLQHNPAIDDGRPAAIGQSTTPLFIGTRNVVPPPEANLDGFESHPRIWGRALTAPEILGMFNDEKFLYGL
jgi:hypothetical protein